MLTVVESEFGMKGLLIIIESSLVITSNSSCLSMVTCKAH